MLSFRQCIFYWYLPKFESGSNAQTKEYRYVQVGKYMAITSIHNYYMNNSIELPSSFVSLLFLLE